MLPAALDRPQQASCRPRPHLRPATRNLSVQLLTLQLNHCAGGRPRDVASSDGSPAAGQLPGAHAPGPGYQLPLADVVFMTEAPAAALTGEELTLTGVPASMHFVTRGMATGAVRTGARLVPHPAIL